MGYANILVSVDLGEAAPDRVKLAAGLARRFEATLTGAAAETVPAPLLVHDIYDAARQEEDNAAKVREALTEAGTVFNANLGEGLRTDWRPALAGPVTHLVDLARAADLVVVGRHGADDDAPRQFDVPPGPVLMEAGRPVLVVPPRIENLKGSRVVVAWKDGPPARRAVSAALPFLRNADHVHVVTTGSDARLQGGEEVAAHLARHGASVATHFLRAVDTDGAEILRFAQMHDADLLVMGAYGHSRLREWVLGGVTREILQRSPICSLMCH
ncbi:nucleotide-binding universal stress UspA family protein [Methylorubrum rhodinum]|uniref:Nucleotide-binding universal stress UspA family protein n=1 Tax=Methylorubrum rhodinum TaxID=29428 RepID=A0A840ZNU4_9HYPH|nr:universal stress protein [Methylorubrum rhodinum]MBB5759000.1 nucleotide-binding universal stress UspA family protein [Methylorubrum rhodinum]